jgi:hypothetical protein
MEYTQDKRTNIQKYKDRIIEEERERNPDYQPPTTFQEPESNEELSDTEKVINKSKGIDKIRDDFSKFHRGMELDMNPAKWAYMSGMGALDVPFDVIGAIPGLGGIDDTWDEVTRFENEGARKFRQVASVVIPTAVTSGAYGKYLAGTKLTGLTRAVANVGGVGVINGGIAAISDYGEDPTNRLLTHPDNFKRLADWFPETFGTQGTYPISQDLQTIDGTSPEINRLLSALDETVLSGVGDLLGYALNAGKPLLWNIKPLNKRSKAWKKTQQLKNIELDTRNRIIDIDTAIQSKTLGKEQLQNLVDEKTRLIDQTMKTGSSEVTQNAADSFVKSQQRSRQAYIDNKAIQKLQTEAAKENKAVSIVAKLKGLSEEDMMKLPKEELLKGVRQLGQEASDEQLAKLGLDRSYFEPKTLDPDITPSLVSETKTTAKPTIPGQAVKNTVDIAAQEAGEVSRNAVPTAPYTDAMREKGLIVGKSNYMIAEIAQNVREAGEYVGFQGQFKASRAARSQAVYNIYEKIMKPGTGEELGKVLNQNGFRDKKWLINEIGENTEITYLNEQASEAAALAISDLIDVYLGRDSQETAARVMSTLGKEISAISNGSKTFKGLLDDDKVFSNVMDRLELLEAQYGSSKYVAGWSLQNKQWWKFWKKGDPGEIAAMTLEEFNKNAVKVHEDFKTFRRTLEQVKKENPKLARTLLEAYDYSDGDINTIIKLNTWAKEQVSPGGLILSGGRGMNLFAKGAWAVTYNNILSGLSGMRAAVGNGSMLMLKPLTTFTRAGVRSILTKDTEPIERVMYLHGSMFETTRRAFSDMTKRMSKVHNDSDFMMKAIRKDFVIDEDNAYKIVDDMAEQWEKEGDVANQFFYGWANLNRKVAKMKWMRTGMTAMAGVDAFTDTFMATFNSRLKAYDDVFGQYGKTLDPAVFGQQLKKAEELNYNQMFDRDGLLTDAAAKNASGEIALNLDDGISTWLNTGLTKVPALKTLMMFPRTGINQVKLALSYTPISLIPGVKSKYAKVLQAGDDINLIKEALASHGVKNFDETPNAMAIYKQLKDEYEGRLMVGGATAIMGYWYAMSGGIRGNGPSNNADRQKLMRKGWRPYTVKIGDNWVSYKGIPMVEQMFALVGDLAYHQTALGSSMTQTALDKLGWTISATYLNNTPLYGIEPLMAVASGDEAAFKRLASNLVRGAIPMSGAVGVVSKAITQAQKDIYDDFWGYVLNTTPARGTLPSQIDYWTGEEVNEIDNHLLRILNATSPVKISGGEEPWRLWLLNSGFDDINIIKNKYNADVAYTAEEREAIGRVMGEMELWKEVEKMRTQPQWNNQLNELRQYINSGANEQEVRQYKDRLPVYQRLRKLIKDAQKTAEFKVASDPRFKHLDILGNGAAIVKNKMERGDIEGAAKQSRENYKYKKNLTNFHRNK